MLERIQLDFNATVRIPKDRWDDNVVPMHWDGELTFVVTLDVYGADNFSVQPLWEYAMVTVWLNEHSDDGERSSVDISAGTLCEMIEMSLARLAELALFDERLQAEVYQAVICNRAAWESVAV